MVRGGVTVGAINCWLRAQSSLPVLVFCFVFVVILKCLDLEAQAAPVQFVPSVSCHSRLSHTWFGISCASTACLGPKCIQFLTLDWVQSSLGVSSWPEIGTAF